MTMPDLQRYLEKLCLISYELDRSMFIILKADYFQNRQYFRHYWSYKGFKGTVVNRALLSLHGRSLEITFVYTNNNKEKQYILLIFIKIVKDHWRLNLNQNIKIKKFLDHWCTHNNLFLQNWESFLKVFQQKRWLFYECAILC